MSRHEWTVTGQDVVTFGLGLGAALAVVMGEALLGTADALADPATWLRSLVVGLGTATGRYLLTEFGPRQARHGSLQLRTRPLVRIPEGATRYQHPTQDGEPCVNYIPGNWSGDPTPCICGAVDVAREE